jgi:general secretion pathway protein A
MYTDYFGFREKPFSITPDPRFFYTNPRYQKAYASLLYGIHEHRGFIVLTGEIGTGKTTLLRRLMENREPHVRFVFFDCTTLTFDEILDYICQELGTPMKESGRLHKIQGLNRFLIDRLAKGETVVLLIDEAQNLGEEVLESLRLLSNIETSTEKLLQIVLVGQPELGTKLNRYELRQLKQRIAIQCRLERLDDEEVGPFIHYRLNAVGYKRQQLFAPDAIRDIAYYSKGFPRLINVLCDNALLVAYATSQRRITTGIVREAAEDLRLESPQGNPVVPEQVAQLSDGWEIQQSSSNPRSGPALTQETFSAGSWRGWQLVTAVLLVAIVGIGSAQWWLDEGFLHDVEGNIRVLPFPLPDMLGGWIGAPGSSKSRLEGYPPATARGQAAGFVREADPAAGSDLPTVKLPIPNQDSRLAAAQRTETESSASHSLSTEGSGGREVSSGAAIPEDTGWRDQPLTVQSGSTVVEIATSVYGLQRNLGLDLMKEYNTHIGNLNRVIAGQKLWLPPLSRETLVRQQPDGSYNMILASLRNQQQSAQLARDARLKGYDVVVTPRRLSDDLTLYRVEIDGLESIDAVNQAWEVAAANQWLPVAEATPSKRF